MIPAHEYYLCRITLKSFEQHVYNFQMLELDTMAQRDVYFSILDKLTLIVDLLASIVRKIFFELKAFKWKFT